MGEWVAANFPQIVAWVGAVVMFAFVFGGRLKKLETTDTHLINTVDALQRTVSELSMALQGINAPRVSAIEQEAHSHDKRLAMVEQGMRSTEERLRQIEGSQNEIKNDIKMLMLTLSRIETRCGVMRERENGEGGRRNGDGG